MPSIKFPLIPFGFTALLAVAALAAPRVALANSHWGSVGTTGSVDEACYANVRLSGFDARLAPGTTQATCTIRYQVFDTFGYERGRVDGLTLDSHLLDNGAYARVEVRLRSYNISTGASAAVADINSDTTPNFQNLPSGYRRFYTTACLSLDFNRFHYYIEVNLVRLASPNTTVQGRPAIARVALGSCII